MSTQKRILANRYEIDRIAGRGGTSVVYRAYDLQAERAVRAIKEINKSKRDVYDMAKLESALIKELYESDQSNAFFPNIIHRFETEKYFYIVQDYLDGESMEDMLRNGAMSDKMFLDSAKQICSFMEFFHNTDRVHSDMKPENIIVLKHGKASTNGGVNLKLKFIDFGTAIKNSTGVTGYTPEYAAPEQYKQNELDKRTDIFNIGATFYHMIYGKKPLKVNDGDRLLTSRERFVFDKKVNPGINRIILKCVEDDRNKRYRSCEQIYKDLCRVEGKTSLHIVSFTLAASLLCLICSFILSIMANNADKSLIDKKYEEYVKVGNYREAIKLDHTNKNNIYIKLIHSFTSDNKLDADEDNFIINEIKAKGSIRKSDSNYGECMYEIGNAYWVYYYPYESGEDQTEIESEKPEKELVKRRIETSYEWFENSLKSKDLEKSHPDKFKRAEILYEIDSFYVNADKMVLEGNDSPEFYIDMWHNLEKLSLYINEQNEVVSARVCETLSSLISINSDKFMKNGVEKESMEKILDQINNKVYSNGEITFNNDMARSIASTIDLDAVKLKIEGVYADNKEK